jgi:hypothetical protein
MTQDPLTERQRRSQWLYEARWGVMCHYLAAPPSSQGTGAYTEDLWQATVDGFDAEGLAAQLAETGARYLLFTLGQNTGFYCSPNETYDALVGRAPSRLSRRDLIADLYDVLAPHGIRLLVYLPSHAAAYDEIAVRALKCTPRWDPRRWSLRADAYSETDPDDRLAEFQGHWEAIIREWSLRWGTKVSGWWIDGCYHADLMYRFPDAPNFASFAAAMRAGNPDSIVAFNPGVKVPIVCHSEDEDYTAGEVANALPVNMDSQWNRADKDEQYWGMPARRYVDGAQLHVLTFMGAYWCGGREPRFSDGMAAGYTQHVNEMGGAITWDVPIEGEGPRNGLIPQPFVDQMKSIGSTQGR